MVFGKFLRRIIMEKIKIEKSGIVSAFSAETIGSKVVKPRFFEALTEAIKTHDLSKDRVEGQMFLPLSQEYFETVSAGVGLRTDNLDDYVVRSHRGRMSIYLRREAAAKVESLAVIVYTAAAYLSDPEVGEAEAERVRQSGATHVVVAVLAAAGPKSPLTPKRFVANLAGGNKEALDWTADEIRQKAEEIRDYYQKWCVVAD
jgi:hypothetical protein